MKKRCAKEAFALIEDGMTVGLGGGRTIAFLIEEIGKSGKRITAVTPSQDTLELCLRHQIPVNPLELTSHIDIGFDGCDEVDLNLNALKSTGGIHTREKIAAVMAKDYILLANEEKYSEQLTFEHPVAVEVVPSARTYVKRRLEELGAEVTERKGDKKMGYVFSDDGNYLMDAKFLKLPYVEELNRILDGIPGIVGHSLFYQIASKAMIASEQGIRMIERSN